jgi:YggT family protein
MNILVVDLVQILCYGLFIAIFVRVVFSWISPYPRNPIHRLAYDITEPVLQPVRRLLPPTMGLDLSPMIVSFILIFILQIVRGFA